MRSFRIWFDLSWQIIFIYSSSLLLRLRLEFLRTSLRLTARRVLIVKLWSLHLSSRFHFLFPLSIICIGSAGCVDLLNFYFCFMHAVYLTGSCTCMVDEGLQEKKRLVTGFGVVCFTLTHFCNVFLSRYRALSLIMVEDWSAVVYRIYCLFWPELEIISDVLASLIKIELKFKTK